MAAGGDLIALALSAVFELCVPGVSQGKLQQTFPSDLLIPLTDKEKITYADEIKNEDTAYHIRADAGFILMTTKGGHCRVMPDGGNANNALEQFRQKLKAAGGAEYKSETSPTGIVVIDAMIPLTKGDAVILVFSEKKNTDAGFFATTFGVHKDQ